MNESKLNEIVLNFFTLHRIQLFHGNCSWYLPATSMIKLEKEYISNLTNAYKQCRTMAKSSIALAKSCHENSVVNKEVSETRRDRHLCEKYTPVDKRLCKDIYIFATNE